MDFENLLKQKRSLILSSYRTEDTNTIVKSEATLVKKKVQIKHKNGTIGFAYRWVDPSTDSAPSISHKKYLGHENKGTNTAIEDVLSAPQGNTEKARKLISLGVYSSKELSKLIGGTFANADAKNLLREAGLGDKIESYNEELEKGNCPLPNKPSKNAVDLNDESGQKLSIAAIGEMLGSKEAFKEQKSRKAEVLEKFGITVDDKWDSYEDDLDMLISGELGLKAVIGYGTGGVGKTFVLESKVLPKHEKIEFDPELDMEKGGDEYDYVKIGGKPGSREIQRILYDHRNKLVIFDDADSMWNDDGLINVLKNVLDTSGKGKCQWAQPLKETYKDAGDEVPSSYVFAGKMIFITNLSKQELEAKGAAAIVESRCASTDLTMNLEQTMERLEKISDKLVVKDEDRQPLEDVTDEDKKAAFNAFKDVSEYGRIDQVNTRVLIGMIAKARFQRRKGLSKEQIQDYLKKQALKQFGY